MTQVWFGREIDIAVNGRKDHEAILAAIAPEKGVEGFRFIPRENSHDFKREFMTAGRDPLFGDLFFSFGLDENVLEVSTPAFPLEKDLVPALVAYEYRCVDAACRLIEGTGVKASEILLPTFDLRRGAATGSQCNLSSGGDFADEHAGALERIVLLLGLLINVRTTGVGPVSRRLEYVYPDSVMPTTNSMPPVFVPGHAGRMRNDRKYSFLAPEFPALLSQNYRFLMALAECLEAMKEGAIFEEIEFVERAEFYRLMRSVNLRMARSRDRLERMVDCLPGGARACVGEITLYDGPRRAPRENASSYPPLTAEMYRALNREFLDRLEREAAFPDTRGIYERISDPGLKLYGEVMAGRDGKGPAGAVVTVEYSFTGIRREGGHVLVENALLAEVPGFPAERYFVALWRTLFRDYCALARLRGPIKQRLASAFESLCRGGSLDLRTTWYDDRPLARQVLCLLAHALNEYGFWGCGTSYMMGFPFNREEDMGMIEAVVTVDHVRHVLRKRLDAFFSMVWQWLEESTKTGTEPFLGAVFTFPSFCGRDLHGRDFKAFSIAVRGDSDSLVAVEENRRPGRLAVSDLLDVQYCVENMYGKETCRIDGRLVEGIVNSASRTMALRRRRKYGKVLEEVFEGAGSDGAGLPCR